MLSPVKMSDLVDPFDWSTRLSHRWISQKRLKLGLWSFRHTVATSL